MKLFDIFDEFGNKIGEVRQEVDDGSGLLFFTIKLIALIGAIIIWPIFFKELTDEKNVAQVIHLILILLATVICIYISVFHEYYCRLGETWNKICARTTIVVSVIYCVFALIVEPQSFQGVWDGIVNFLMILFVTFELSVASSLLAAIIAKAIRRMVKGK